MQLLTGLNRWITGIPNSGYNLECRVKQMPLEKAYLVALAAAELVYDFVPDIESIDLPEGASSHGQALLEAARQHYRQPLTRNYDNDGFVLACIKWADEEAIKGPDHLPLRERKFYNVVFKYAFGVKTPHRNRLLATRSIAMLSFAEPLNPESIVSRRTPERRSWPMVELVSRVGEIYCGDKLFDEGSDFAYNCWTGYRALKKHGVPE